AFSGFTFGSFVGLQEFGLGLSAAILLDATVVRAILVPAVMKLLGDWNWYLPARLSRVLRVPPSPARRRAQLAGGELDDDRRPPADADVLPARQAAGPAAQAPAREADEPGVETGGLRAAALRHVDEAVGLVVVDGQRGALAQDEPADRSRLGLRPRLGAGARPVLGR